MPYSVEDLYKHYEEALGLELLTEKKSLKRNIKVPEAHRPGLPLAGYFKGHAERRILIFGKVEIQFLRDLEKNVRIERLRALLGPNTPAILLARYYRPPKELLTLCLEYNIPLFRARLSTMNLLSKLTLLLTEEFAPRITISGCLVEVFGVGVLIQGKSGVGKSEAALGLVKRGHHLIADDVVRIRKNEGELLEGMALDISKGYMEIRGIGIVDVSNLYGSRSVKEKKSLDIVVKLEVWDDDHFYDRVGLEETHLNVLGVSVPYRLLPVNPGSDVVLLLETIALNDQSKRKGHYSAKEFSKKLHSTLSAKHKAIPNERNNLGRRS